VRPVCSLGPLGALLGSCGLPGPAGGGAGAWRGTQAGCSGLARGGRGRAEVGVGKGHRMHGCQDLTHNSLGHGEPRSAPSTLLSCHTPSSCPPVSPDAGPQGSRNSGTRPGGGVPQMHRGQAACSPPRAGVLPAPAAPGQPPLRPGHSQGPSGAHHPLGPLEFCLEAALAAPGAWGRGCRCWEVLEVGCSRGPPSASSRTAATLRSNSTLLAWSRILAELPSSMSPFPPPAADGGAPPAPKAAPEPPSAVPLVTGVLGKGAVGRCCGEAWQRVPPLQHLLELEEVDVGSWQARAPRALRQARVMALPGTEARGRTPGTAPPASEASAQLPASRLGSPPPSPASPASVPPSASPSSEGTPAGVPPSQGPAGTRR